MGRPVLKPRVTCRKKAGPVLRYKRIYSIYSFSNEEIYICLRHRIVTRILRYGRLFVLCLYCYMIINPTGKGEREAGRWSR